MPSYFVKVMAQDKGIAFVFDSVEDVKASNWNDVQKSIIDAANEAWRRTGEQTCDPKTMSVIALSRL